VIVSVSLAARFSRRHQIASRSSRERLAPYVYGGLQISTDPFQLPRYGVERKRESLLKPLRIVEGPAGNLAVRPFVPLRKLVSQTLKADSQFRQTLVQLFQIWFILSCMPRMLRDADLIRFC
jgi:hypothetical protein